MELIYFETTPKASYSYIQLNEVSFNVILPGSACQRFHKDHALEVWLKWEKDREDLWEAPGSSPNGSKILPIKKRCVTKGKWQNPGPQTSVHDIIRLQSRDGQTCRKGPRFPSEESTDRLKFFPSHFLQTRNIHAKLSNKNIRVYYRGPGRNSTKKCGCRLLKQEMSLLYLIFSLNFKMDGKVNSTRQSPYSTGTE